MFDGLPQLRAVFEAADALLAARETQMLTRQEWEDLGDAVTAARDAEAAERLESFAVESDSLVRRVAPSRGVPHERRCPLEAFGAMVQAVAALGATPFVLDDLCARASVSRAPGAVAMAFLKTRGRIVNAGRCKHVAARGFTPGARSSRSSGIPWSSPGRSAIAWPKKWAGRWWTPGIACSPVGLAA